MKKCQFCGAEIEDYEKRCSNCGVLQMDDEPQEEPTVTERRYAKYTTHHLQDIDHQSETIQQTSLKHPVGLMIYFSIIFIANILLILAAIFPYFTNTPTSWKSVAPLLLIAIINVTSICLLIARRILGFRLILIGLFMSCAFDPLNRLYVPIAAIMIALLLIIIQKKRHGISYMATLQ